MEGRGRQDVNRRIGRYAPWPFVGVAVVLVALILLTPVLISNGQPAPGVLTQADLIVDRLAGASSTHFYVRGVGATARYADITIGAASNFTWDGSSPLNWSALRFTTFWNATNVLSLQFSSDSNPIALNITAYYDSPSGTAFYVGEFAFLVGGGSSGPTLYSASARSDVTVAATTPIDNSSLPMLIVLAHLTGGAVP